MPPSFGTAPSPLSIGRSMRVLLRGVAAVILFGCSTGYTPPRAPEPDLGALLDAPRYASVQIIHEPDARRSVTAAVFAGAIVVEYLVDDKLVGSHMAHKSFDEVLQLPGGDHEIVIQQCYRGVITLGARDCQYVKYHFRIRPGERGRIDVAANVLRPETAGFVQWHEVEDSRY